MDIVLLEDTTGAAATLVEGDHRTERSTPPTADAARHRNVNNVVILSSHGRGPDVPPAWMHPELKRLRVEHARRTQETGKWSEIIETKQRIAHDRVARLTNNLNQKKTQLDALTRRRDQLAQEVDSEGGIVENLQKVQEAFGDQLIYHKSMMTASSANIVASGAPSVHSTTASVAPSSLWFEEPEQQQEPNRKEGGRGSNAAAAPDPQLFDGGPYALVPSESGEAAGTFSLLSHIPPCRVQVLGLLWKPLSCRAGPWHATQRDSLKRWLELFLPIADVNSEGFVCGIGRISQGCLMENATATCPRVGCRYQHLQHNVAHLQIVCKHLLRGVASLFDSQALHICSGASFLAESRQALAQLMVHSSTPKDVVAHGIEKLVLSIANHVIECGWYTAMKSSSALDPSVVSGEDSAGALTSPVDPSTGRRRHKFYRAPTATHQSGAEPHAIFAAPVWAPLAATTTSRPRGGAAAASLLILERIFDKSLQYLAANDELNALEYVALQCSTAIASRAPSTTEGDADESLSANEIATMVVKNAMEAFAEAQLAILWRLAARAYREVRQHRRAEWLLQTAIKMFPVDPALRIELVHTIFAVGDGDGEDGTEAAAPDRRSDAATFDVGRVMRTVSTSLDILTHQANALILSKQKVALVNVLSKSVAYLIAFTAARMARRSREAATALLTCAVDAPGRYCIGPIALHNLAIMLALMRGVGKLDGLAEIIPLASVSDVCFTIRARVPGEVAAETALGEETLCLMKQQLQLMQRAGEGGVNPKVMECTRSAMYTAIVNVHGHAPQVVADTLGKLEVEPRTFHSEVWGQYATTLAQLEGREFALNALKAITVQPNAPMWLQLRLASALAEFHCPVFLQERLQAVVNHFSTVTGCNAQTQLTPELCSDAQVHHQRFKQTALNWIAFIICAAATTRAACPADALMLLRAVPRRLLSIQLDASVVLCYEQIGYCLRAMAVDMDCVESKTTSPSIGSSVIKSGGPPTSPQLPQGRVDTFRDIVRQELELLQEAYVTPWLSMVDWYAEHAITAAHTLCLEIYRNLPSMCPPVRAVQLHIVRLRCELLDVASSVGALHPLLQHRIIVDKHAL